MFANFLTIFSTTSPARPRSPNRSAQFALIDIWTLRFATTRRKATSERLEFASPVGPNGDRPKARVRPQLGSGACDVPPY